MRDSAACRSEASVYCPGPRAPPRAEPAAQNRSTLKISPNLKISPILCALVRQPRTNIFRPFSPVNSASATQLCEDTRRRARLPAALTLDRLWGASTPFYTTTDTRSAAASAPCPLKSAPPLPKQEAGLFAAPTAAHMSAEYDKDSGRYEKLSEKNDEERNPVVRGGLGEDGEGDFDEDSDPRMIMKSLEGKKGKELKDLARKWKVTPHKKSKDFPRKDVPKPDKQLRREIHNKMLKHRGAPDAVPAGPGSGKRARSPSSSRAPSPALENEAPRARARLAPEFAAAANPAAAAARARAHPRARAAPRGAAGGVADDVLHAALDDLHALRAEAQAAQEVADGARVPSSDDVRALFRLVMAMWNDRR